MFCIFFYRSCFNSLQPWKKSWLGLQTTTLTQQWQSAASMKRTGYAAIPLWLLVCRCYASYFIFSWIFLCWVTMVTLHINMRPYACTFGVHRQPTRRLWHCLTENSMSAEGKLSPGSTERDQLLLLLLLLQLLPPAIGLF